MYNPDYHEQSEQIDDKLFKDFCRDTRYFTEYNRMPKFSTVDYSAKDKKGREFLIELKKRNNPHSKFETTFIETEKFWYMVNKFEQYQRIPLYINFYSNDVCIIFNLKEIKHPDKVSIEKARIRNHGYDEEQNVWRVLLPNNTGIKFTKDNNGWHLENK